MKLCVAQIRPVKGDIPANIERHKKFISMAVSNSADIIIFPELSLTGYEPTLAQELAADKNDNRFNDFQNISDKEIAEFHTVIKTKNLSTLRKKEKEMIIIIIIIIIIISER